LVIAKLKAKEQDQKAATVKAQRHLRGRILKQVFRCQLTYDGKDPANAAPLRNRSVREYNDDLKVHANLP
jgi:hypothetical protein